MKVFIVSIRDAAVEAYMTPIFVTGIGLAVRSFGDECKKNDSELANHLEDYALFHVGEFDTESGAVLSLPWPVLISRGTDYKVAT